MAPPTNRPHPPFSWWSGWQRTFGGWLGKNHTWSTPPEHLPPSLQRHYQTLTTQLQTYQRHHAQVQQRIRRNKDLMQEAVRLRVQFAQSATYADRAAVFDRVVVMLNQQVDALKTLDHLYVQALSDIEAQVALLDSTLYAALDELVMNWIPDIQRWQQQVEDLEQELLTRRIFMDLGSRPE